MRLGRLLVYTGVAITLTACSRESDGPPQVRLGETPCAHCDMIVSDERFATATVIESDRGPEDLFFDDFGCQLDYEKTHPDLKVLERWSHDYNTHQWFRVESGYFVESEEIHAPMASHLAVFETREQADKAAAELNGRVISFSELWARE